MRSFGSPVAGASSLRFVTGLQQLFLRVLPRRQGNHVHLVSFDCTLPSDRKNVFAVA